MRGCAARSHTRHCWTSTLIGASSVDQLETNVAALGRLDFGAEELAEIDRYATDSGINIWSASSDS